MSTSIASSSETLLVSLPSSSNTPVELNVPADGASRKTGRVATPAGDTVTLSVSAQVRHLVRQGQSVNQIANTLGLTESLVNSYLYVPLPGVSVGDLVQPG